jgi:CHAT domain-containing protein
MVSFSNFGRLQIGWLVGLVLLSPIQDAHRVDAQVDYEHTKQLFLRGYLEKSEHAAEQGYVRFRDYNPTWAAKFELLQAEIMSRRGMYEDALRLVAASQPASGDSQELVRKLVIEGVVFTRLRQLSLADQRLGQAESLCKGAGTATCGEAMRARGILAVSEGKPLDARLAFIETLAFARGHQDRYLESTAALNLGWLALQGGHFDESVDWSTIAHQISMELGAEDLAENVSGNLGWAYFKLGDTDRALELFTEAEKRAAGLGNTRNQVKWLTTTGNVYQDTGDFDRAVQFYSQSLALAKQIDSKEDIINSLEDLAQASIDAGKQDEASSCLEQLDPILRVSGNHLDELDVTLAKGRMAARRNDPEAEDYLRSVEADPESQTSMRLGAEHALAQLFESQGKTTATDRMYRTALETFESARAQLKNEDSKLPFLANATRIYDDYIHFLIAQGKPYEALAAADRSRALTLAQGLGSTTHLQSFRTAALHPEEIAHKAGATLLFYWLGEKQSYLWAVTAKKTAVFSLPTQSLITPIVTRYRKDLLGLNDAVESANADGLALYQTLVAPAKDFISPDSTVVILNDGALSQLNFETLITPGPKMHYWIEDVALISAPSLYMLAAAKPSLNSGHKLLLLGDAVSPSPDYPELPMAGYEMRQIQKHFSSADETVFARQAANSSAYLTSAPQQFSYIHFVAHGVASRTEPLDSAIILSRATTAEDSFKLYAREIIQHPIHARLVTISACYGSGMRSFAGEGLVGLSWAFLRAGAHNVIGALWEVSDDSTPRLMGNLYQGLEDGLTPSAALRQAKLALLHSGGDFRKPFFWAPFQIYAGL